MHPLCIHCVLISYVMPIKQLYSVISSAEKVLNCTKHFERMNFTPFTMTICNIYEQQTNYVSYHSLNVCGILSDPLDLLSTHTRCFWKRRETGKKRYKERLYIVSSTDIERCKRMHLVCLFVCGFSSHSRIVHSYRDVTLDSEEAEKFDICSALMAIEQWGFFGVPHPLAMSRGIRL